MGTKYHLQKTQLRERSNKHWQARCKDREKLFFSGF
jgi:hypothetical protein